jgi:VCBS repeat-containing protein
MKTLTIKDLDRAETLDRATMTTVRGGWNVFAPSYKMGDYTYAPTSDSSINAMQGLSQQQNVMTATANDSAFLSGVSVNNDTHQNGKNKIIG